MGKFHILLVTLSLHLLGRLGAAEESTTEGSLNEGRLAIPLAIPCSKDPKTIRMSDGVQFSFSSPNFPNLYPAFHKCSWIFEANPGSKLSLNCDPVYLNWFSYIFVKDGNQVTRQGCTICTIMQFSHEFKSNVGEVGLDNTLFFRGKGFSCRITASEAPVTTTASTPARLNPTCNCGVPRSSTRIVGGKETEEHEYPWMALMVRRSSGGAFCGGSIISNKYILTAAHCTIRTSAYLIAVRLGVHRIDDPPSSSLYRPVERILNHPNYNANNQDYDVSILLIETIDFFQVGPTIRPICLPVSNSDYAGVMATVAGWGRIKQNGSPSNYLQEVDVPVVTTDECRRMYGGYTITDRMLCAGEDGKDSCQGDSGGAIWVNSAQGPYKEQVGVVSWGIGCAERYGVYSRVTELRSWIIKNIIDSTTCHPPS